MTNEQKARVNYLVKEMCYQSPYALAELEDMMHEVLFCFLKKFNSNDTIIEEAINDTFKTVAEKCKTRILFLNCSSWIMQISKFKLFNIARKKKNKDDKQKNEYVSIDKLCYSFEEHSDCKLTLEFVLPKLDDRQRQLFFLRFKNKEKIKTIARCMKISARTVDRDIAKLKAILQKEFDPWIK